MSGNNDNNHRYVIGIDGGGAKTAAALADLQGKILARIKTGPSNINKADLKTAIDNVIKALNQMTHKYPPDKIVYIYIALAGGLERDKKKTTEIKKHLVNSPELSWLSSKDLLIEGDHKAAFFSGTEQEDGVLVIAGTGSIAIGWNRGEEKITGGWDYLVGDNGSGFWLGQKALQAIASSYDGLIPKTLFHQLILKKLNIKTEADLLRKVYQPQAVKIIASLASVINTAAEKGDKSAKKILIQAANELALRANLTIHKLNFTHKKFPLVLVGGVFKSKIVLSQVKKEIKKFAPDANFIRPKQEPVVGAVKLALKNFRSLNKI